MTSVGGKQIFNISLEIKRRSMLSANAATRSSHGVMDPRLSVVEIRFLMSESDVDMSSASEDLFPSWIKCLLTSRKAAPVAWVFPSIEVQRSCVPWILAWISKTVCFRWDMPIAAGSIASDEAEKFCSFQELGVVDTLGLVEGGASGLRLLIFFKSLFVTHW